MPQRGDIKKDFLTWHKKKQEIHDAAIRRFYHEREVWWCSLGLNVGFEMDGKGEDFARPVLIIKGFSVETFIGVPLTTRKKKSVYYAEVNLGDGVYRQAALSQVRMIDTKRLQEKIGTLGRKQFRKIKQAVLKMLK